MSSSASPLFSSTHLFHLPFLSLLFLLFSLLLLSLSSPVAADLALLTYPKESQGPTVCFVYNSAFNDISRTNNNSSYSAVPIIESFPADGCGNLTSTDRYSGKAILIQRGNCSFAVKASLAQLYGAKLVVIANSDPSAGAFAPGANSSDYESITLPVGMISYQDSQALLLALHSNNNLTIDITTPTANPVDPSFFIMCFSAVVVVILGAFWANNLERTRLNWQIQTLNNGNENENNSTNASRGNNQNNSESSTHRQVADTSLDQNATGQGEQLTLSVKNVLIFLVIAVSIILLMYFLYDYLVYIVIGLFCMGSCNAIFSLAYPLVSKVPYGTYEIQFPYLGRISIRSLLLALCCMGFTIFWAINRNASFGWILQDILGVAFVIVIIKSIRLPNLKITSILLILFFFYDIFFVFITPYFTGNGESVMVQVATGGGTSTEQLPMVFKLPKLADPYKVCGSSFTVLGFGDLVMPGFLVAFCLTFDYKRRMFDVLLKGSLKGKVMVRVYENPSSESSSTSKPTEDASESSSSSSSSSHSNGNGNNDHQSYQMQNTTQEQEEQQQSQREQHQVVFKSGELLDESITLAKTHPHVLQPNWIIHFVACISAYFVGIIITYIVLVLSESAQPALLYLVPCTLGCTIGLGWWKGELVLLWRGICYVQEEVNEIGSELIHQEPENGLSELDIQDDRDDTRLLAK